MRRTKPPRRKARARTSPSWRAAQEALRERRKQRGWSLKLAKELRISLQAVHQWRVIPAERVVDVERITGEPRQQLRPDLYEQTQSG